MNYFMSLPSELQNYLGRCSSENKGKSKAFIIGCAKAISDSLVIQKLPVIQDLSDKPNLKKPLIEQNNEIDLCFKQHRALVSGFLNDINSSVIIDMFACLELIENLYKYRYSQLYGSRNLFLSKDHALEDFLGISMYVAPTLLQEVKDNPNEVAYHYSKIKEIFSKELNHGAE
jgi:hypothetical protein